MKKYLMALVAMAHLSACNWGAKLQEAIYVYVSGEVAAALSAEASVAVQERLLESLTGMDLEYTGDGQWVIIPIQSQPPLGMNGNGAVTGATLAYAPAAATSAVSATGYIAATEAGPDGSSGWYKRDASGITFYYKTQPAADLSQGWPKNVQVLYAGWRGQDGSTYKGYRWWMQNEVVSSTHVRGAWRFEIGTEAANYAGTGYGGTYDYERVPNTKVAVLVTGDMKLVNGATTREGYTNYAYGFTAEGNVETGRYYYGNGPAQTFTEVPAWEAGKNPAGDQWTDAQARPGLNLYRVWVDRTTSWWKYDGTSQFCSTEPSYLVVRGGGGVTAGRSLQLSADAYNNCNDRLKYRSIAWTSSAPDIATVSDSGVVSALKAGDATITATSGTGTGSTTVSVRELDRKPATIVVSGGTSVQTGGTLQLTARVYNKSNEQLEGVVVSWSSLNAGAASVSQSGVVSGIADGTAVIRASAEGVNGDRSVRVYDAAAVNSISLYCPRTSVVAGGASVACSASAYNYSGTYLSGAVLNWSSSNGSVLSVDSSGNVNGLAKGSATVTVSSTNGKQASANFIVYSQADIAYVTVASANGSTLRTGDASFKLALQAKAFNYNGDEIPGVSFTWTSTLPTRASVMALSPNSSAEVSAGSQEGYAAIRATTPNSVIGEFQVGSWDNRIHTVTIVNSSLNSIGSINIALGGTAQIYVLAENINGRDIGYITPAYTADSGLSVDGNGLVTATGAGTGKQLQVSVPKGDGSGNATDTLTVNVYDPSVVTSLTSSCTSAYDRYAGNTLGCSAWAYNQLGQAVSGAPVSWYTSNATLVDVTSENDSGWPATAQYTVPAGLLSGGAATIRAYTNCNGAPQLPNLTNCLVSTIGTVNAKGTQDVRYVTVSVVPAVSEVAKGQSVTLQARAWDWQGSAQEIAGVSFTYYKTSGSSFGNPDGLGNITALAQSGNSVFRACVAPANSLCSDTDGVSSSDTVTLSVFDAAYATSITYVTSPASLSTLKLNEAFTVWAFARNSQSQPVTNPTFNFTNGTGRLNIVKAGNSAAVKFTKCDCSGATRTESLTITTSSGTGSTSFNVTVGNPVYNIAVSPANNTRIDEGAFQVLSSIVTGYLGEPATTGTTVSYSESSSFFSIGGASSDTITNTTYTPNSLTVTVTAQHAASNSSSVQYWTFYIDPPTLTLPVSAGPTPLLQNNTLALEHFYFDGAEAALAAVSNSLLDVAAPDGRTFTTQTQQSLLDWSGSAYGLRNMTTGDFVTSNIGVRVAGYVKFNNPGATYYLRTQAYERLRVWIEGTLVIDEWNNGATPLNRTYKLANVDDFPWYAIEIEGLLGAAQTSYGRKLAHLSWSTDGSYFTEYPANHSVNIARDP